MTEKTRNLAGRVRFPSRIQTRARHAGGVGGGLAGENSVGDACALTLSPSNVPRARAGGLSRQSAPPLSSGTGSRERVGA
jgi:hypothetical protein